MNGEGGKGGREDGRDGWMDISKEGKKEGNTVRRNT